MFTRYLYGLSTLAGILLAKLQKAGTGAVWDFPVKRYYEKKTSTRFSLHGMCIVFCTNPLFPFFYNTRYGGDVPRGFRKDPQ